jgi:hypothetical protein
MTVLRVLLPVIWAIVSTIIALLLYKTSKALFVSDEKRSENENKVRRRLSLAGSVVIAGIAFVGMKYATPIGNITESGVDRISTVQAKACAKSFERLKTSLEVPGSSHDDTIVAMRRYLVDCEPVISELTR